MEEVIERGRKEVMYQIAKNLLKSGLNMDEVSKMTGLDKDTIEKCK